MEKDKEIPDSMITDWLVYRELQRLQERRLAATWAEEIKLNKNTDLWMRLRKK